jgi:hypothetical protein
MYNRPGVGGLLGASTSHKIGTIKMFYYFRLDGVETTFVDIMDHPVEAKQRSMYIIATVPALLRGRDRYPVTAATTLYSIDAITSKVLLVPHFTPALAATKMCAICMWDAR